MNHANLLTDAFGHHVWATVRLIDACSELSDEQLGSVATGTFGSILDTMRHLVGADGWYLHVISAGAFPSPADEADMGLSELRAAMERQGAEWSRVVTADLDPTANIVRVRDDGTESHAPLGVRLAQVIHHGTDHRSQICTALSELGIEPPEIDVWAYGWEDGRVFEVESKAAG